MKKQIPSIMKLNRMMGGALTVATLCCALTAVAGLEIKTEKEDENVIGSRLIGKWKTHASLSERLRGETNEWPTVVFVEDKTVAAKVPALYSEALKQKPVYLAGMMTINGDVHPFILTEYNGNPCVVCFYKHGDPESCELLKLVIAPAKDKAKDLLFIGGDRNEPFCAFERDE
jgi:hypothetical protein